MGYPAPVSMIDVPTDGASMTPGSAVHWTQFPAHAMAVDWSDHRATHRAVMRLFADDLGGPERLARSGSGILYRVDVLNEVPVVLVQSQVVPMLVPAQARTMVLSGRTWALEPGARVRFRVAVNPIVRNGRAKTEKVLSTDAVPEWIAQRLAPALSDVEVLNHYRDSYIQKHRGRPVQGGDRLTVDVIDGHAVVADTAALNRLRLDGVGRRKSYGAGLLTVQQIG